MTAVVVLLLVSFELCLRVLAPQPPRGMSAGLFEQRDGLAFMVPGSRGTQIGREYSVALAGGQDGYRSGLSSPSVAGVARAWFLGDSFAFGWGVEASMTFSARLVDAGLPCANWGIPGDGIGDYGLRLEQAIAGGERLRSITVLLYDNDLVEEEVVPPAAFRLRTALLESHAVRLLARGLDAVGWSRQAADVTGFQSARAAILRRDLSLHRRDGAPPNDKLEALRALLERAAGTGVPVLLMRIVPVYCEGGPATQRALDSLGETARDYDFEALDVCLQKIATAASAHFARFGPANEAEEQSWYFTHDLHLTPTGHAALATRVRTELEALR